jgi:chemosensory pili system protein ChpA (sensor histidine kinase/response regulator)
VQSFRANDALTFNVDKLSLLQQWLEHVKHYLTTFAQADAGCALVAHLQNADWALPWSSEDSAACLAQMQSSGTSVANLADQTRKQSATSDDVSLIIPSDVNKELLDILLQELPTYTQQFSESLQRLQTGGSAQDVEIAQRVAHTIKGSANTVGVKGIAVLTHHLEDILLVCAKEHKLPKGALMNSLITASDCLETMTESLLGMSDAPSEARAVLQEILDWANQIDQHGIPDAADIVAPTAISHDNVEDATSVKPETAENTETAPTAQVSMVRVPTEQIENLFRLSSESIILNGQIFERHRRIKNQIQAMEAQFILLQQLGSELDQLIDLKDLSGRSFVQSGKDFDALEMDQYNELHTASRRMVEAAVDAREISIDVKKELELMSGVLDYQQRLVIDTQESIMQTRLVPVASITPRLQRGLRQTCRLTGKQCDLVLAGEQLLIDGDTLNALVDPLMHVLRNAIDHGIENEEERLASGKPQTGKISINFDREGNSILVRVCDDGKGLDYDAIRATAEKRGALQAGQIVSEDELKRFILQPNFSTRTVSTQTSGRGVGMDAVRFQVINLGGVLTLHSEKGKGLTVDLLIPLPLSRSHALLANVCQHKVAITSKGLVQIVYSGADELTMTDNHRTLVMGDDVYPVVKLEDLLHITDHRKDHRPHNAVLMVQTEDKITAVLVSSISDSRDVVIKSLGYYLGKIQGFIGATILGDGSVIPVLDIPELLRSPTKSGQSSNALFNFNNINEATDAQTDQPSVLVVDDSLSQRRALEQILQDAGYKVYIARDGIEAVEFLSHTKVNVVLTDLEMPRMNGIELASHIRTQARTKDLPIIMITSRTTQKHRQMSEDAGVNFYLVKPVQDDDLLTKIYGLINMSVHEVSA